MRRVVMLHAHIVPILRTMLLTTHHNAPAAAAGIGQYALTMETASGVVPTNSLKLADAEVDQSGSTFSGALHASCTALLLASCAAV